MKNPISPFVEELKHQTVLMEQQNLLLKKLVAHFSSSNKDALDTYLSVSQAAKILKCSRSNVRKLILQKKLEAFKLNNHSQSRYLIPHESIEHFLRKKQFVI